MILKPHPAYGLPHAIAVGYDGSTPFEQCLSSVTVAIGQLERLGDDLSPDQRHRIASAAARLAACLKEQEQ